MIKWKFRELEWLVQGHKAEHSRDRDRSWVFCIIPSASYRASGMSKHTLCLSCYLDLHIHHGPPIPADPDVGAGEHLGEWWCAYVCHVGLHVPGPAHASRAPACAGKEAVASHRVLFCFSFFSAGESALSMASKSHVVLIVNLSINRCRFRIL